MYISDSILKEEGLIFNTYKIADNKSPGNGLIMYCVIRYYNAMGGLIVV